MSCSPSTVSQECRSLAGHHRFDDRSGPPLCFSPAASFVAAGLTGVIGALTLTRVIHGRELPLAAMPLLFAAQQTLEGLLWLALPAMTGDEDAAALTFVYLLFAHVLWPTFSPAAALLIEPDRRRRILMLPILIIGMAMSGYLLWALVAHPHTAQILQGHIVYSTELSHPTSLGPAYVATVSLPLMLSSRRAVFVFGLIVLVGSATATVFYWRAFQSVWCFFAAAGSIVLLGHFAWARRRRIPVAAA